MKEVINALRALQDVDQDRIDAEKERQAITDRVQDLVARVAELEREQSEKRDKLREAEKWYQERDRELKEDNEKIKRAQMRLNALSKQKEYAAVQREIESLRHGNQVREEEILKLQAVMTEFKAAVDEEEKLLDEMRQDLSREQASSVERVAQLDSHIGSLEHSYKDYEANIPPETLRRYKRIQKAWLGMAVVPVDTKGSCGGCHRRLPPQLYNTLLRNDALHTCPYCNRFVFVDVREACEDE
ncbi:MAG TPA: C4-type zinc ribbon domain-containing protein [Myxococcota bacterium]|nr:hypothetical protein [Myxococcota bacterium]HNZ04729.1 C4-type zinc ribbon domain-containing protein [Myxococcota bacterium]HOD07564.1 C4-type zinc ribbon domain-containing protein [Myxococcota bacterium]HPB50950.1 C4-type zinc ribbon domain-containing protein [Myxococcota bacterium]HQP96512.1 C4-type zinc ribbon domain-containing protein [Myxococcota bacterium]